MHKALYELGNCAKDKMTGRNGTIEGIAVYRHDPIQYWFLYIDKKGEHCTEWIAEDRLELTES